MDVWEVPRSPRSDLDRWLLMNVGPTRARWTGGEAPTLCDSPIEVVPSRRDGQDWGGLFVPPAPPAGTLGRMSDVTRLIDAAAAGDPKAAAELLPLVYDELRRLAA